MGNNEYEDQMKQLYSKIFPGWDEWFDKIWPMIKEKLSFEYSEKDCVLSYVDLKSTACLNYHNLTLDVKQNIFSVVWYVIERMPKGTEMSQCREFIECAMSCDRELFWVMENYWFYSFYETKIPEDEFDTLFWYSIDNPIKLPAIWYNKLYLNKLINKKDWAHIKYERSAWIPNPKLWNGVALIKSYEFFWKDWSEAKVVDVYKTFDHKGNFITNLYICPYYNWISKNAPMWFILED